MIERIKTENGERWAIVLHEMDSLENVAEMANGLVELMQTATDANTFSGSMGAYFWGLELLNQMLITPEQAHEYEKLLKQKN